MASYNSLQTIVNQYHYNLDKNRIALSPANPRDSAKLLIYRRKDKKIFFETFCHIDKYLPKNAVLVFNDTKVLPARLSLFTKRGTKRSALILSIQDNSVIALLNKNIEKGSKLFLNNTYYFTVIKQEGKKFILKPSFYEHPEAVMDRFGNMPIPGYLENTSLSENKLRKKYQTIFAKNLGSIAAPTASLHFTNRLVGKLRKKGFKVECITLHVNEGTFAPLTQNALINAKLHKEIVRIDSQTKKRLNDYRKSGKTIIPVGTTVTRALESLADSSGHIKKSHIQTDLFIRPGYDFKICDGIITNFHVPSSSLMMLTASFIGRQKLLELYEKAKENNFSFLSFGDAMLIV